MTHWHDLIDNWEELVDEKGSVVNWVEGLIQSSTLDEYDRMEAEGYLHMLDDNEELQNIVILHLLNHQVDNIDAGRPYNQGDIKRKLKRL